MAVQFTYPDMWSFYLNASEEARISLLEQIEHILPTVSSRVKKEILKDAPEEVLERYTVPVQPTLSQLRKELRRYTR